MNAPERFRREEKPDEMTDDEREQLEHLARAADAAGIAGVYNPSETGENK